MTLAMGGAAEAAVLLGKRDMEKAGGVFSASLACKMKNAVFSTYPSIKESQCLQGLYGMFQVIPMVTNGFMRTLRGYVALGKFPVSMLDMPTEFSPIRHRPLKAKAVQGFCGKTVVPVNVYAAAGIITRCIGNQPGLPTEFSPIDSTAEAIVKLASVKGGFSVFHAYSSYLIQMADVILPGTSLPRFPRQCSP